MLKSYLVSPPFTKFIVIEDNLEQRGQPLLDFILKQHLELYRSRVHYFVFQENINRLKRNLLGKKDIVIHDFSSNPLNWNKQRASEDFGTAIDKLCSRDVVIVDSLANVIYQNGLAETYKQFNTLRHKINVQQIITLLHTDLLQDKIEVNPLFGHLCSLFITMLPKFNSDRCRVKYLYKKIGGKIINQIEEYYFDGGIFHSEKIELIDAKKLIENASPAEVNPETLSTFRIGLTDKERESKEQLVLPYLPTKDGNEEGGKIIYQFEDIDDWDEEDPDDDLDI